MSGKSASGARKVPGSIWNNNGYWYWSVTLPGEARRRKIPLKMPGSDRPMRAEKAFCHAERAAWRLWEEAAGRARRRETNLTVSDLCDEWQRHCLVYYRAPDGRPTSEAHNATLPMREFRALHGGEFVVDLVHRDMVRLRDAWVARGLSRQGVNRNVWTVKKMLAWALDEGLIPAVCKAELSQTATLKPHRSEARETEPVRPVDDETVERTLAELVPNTADMVRVQRLTGMRPGEACALAWSRIDTSRIPWVYRPEGHKNRWRGQPRVICIGPRAREILSRHRGAERPFSPMAATLERFERMRAERRTPVYPSTPATRAKANPERTPGPAWDTDGYRQAIEHACRRAGIEPWGPNRLRHSFATAVRRRFGLEATRAVLGHSMGARVTDRYSFDALEDEIVAKARDAVEALG